MLDPYELTSWSGVRSDARSDAWNNGRSGVRTNGRSGVRKDARKDAWSDARNDAQSDARSDTWNDTWNNGWVARQIDVTSRVERRWKQWKQSLGKFSCILYNYNPAVNSSMDITVFSTPIFLFYSPRGTFSVFNCTEYT